MGNLRTRTIRLAHRTPALRPHLLPILASVSRADALLDELADLAAARAPVADAVVRALESALSRKNVRDRADLVQVTDRGRVVEVGYISDLPRGGARDVGKFLYDNMVEKEITAWRRVLRVYLAPHMEDIQNVSIHDGEKSWIYTRITLK
jgi:hypothetical protein